MFFVRQVRHRGSSHHHHSPARNVRRLHPAVRSRRTVGSHRKAAHAAVSDSFTHITLIQCFLKLSLQAHRQHRIFLHQSIITSYARPGLGLRIWWFLRSF